MRIRIWNQDPKNVHMDPDPESPIFYSDPDPDPKGVNIKEDNLDKTNCQLNFSKWHQNTIKNK